MPHASIVFTDTCIINKYYIYTIIIDRKAAKCIFENARSIKSMAQDGIYIQMNTINVHIIVILVASLFEN